MRRTIGTSAALATPFDAAGHVDWPLFAGHAKDLLASGMNAVTAFGTTGEGTSIAADERAALYDRMSAHGVAPGQLVECVYGPSAVDAGRHMKRALESGCAGILLTPPFYYKDVGDEGVFLWYAEVFETAGAISRNVIVYNIPQLTGVTIGPALLGRLRETFPGVIAGIKDSAGDWAHTAALLAEHRDLAVLVGNEAHLARAVREGASGAISGVANFAPGLVAGLIGGVHDPAIDSILDDLLKMPVVPAIKAVMAIRSATPSWGRVRAPLEAIGKGADMNLCERIAAWDGRNRST